jgi:hypothetical protein
MTLFALTVALLLTLRVPVCQNASQTGVAGSDERLCFVDEGRDVQDFAAFREELQSAVKERSVDRLLRYVASDVRMEGRDNRGHQNLVRLYNLRNPNAPLWRELEDILRLGGRFVATDRFCAPYVSCPGLPMGDARHVVILGEDVPVYERPTTESRVVMRLSCDLLRAAEGDNLPPIPNEPSVGFTAVYLRTGRWAYVRTSMARSPASYSAYFEKRAGRWQLARITAGD